jgi:hypothetical protein
MCVLVSLKSPHRELPCPPPMVAQALSDSSRKSCAARFTAVCVTANCSGDVACSGRSWAVWNSGDRLAKERSGLLRRTHSSPSPDHCAGFDLIGRRAVARTSSRRLLIEVFPGTTHVASPWALLRLRRHAGQTSNPSPSSRQADDLFAFAAHARSCILAPCSSCSRTPGLSRTRKPQRSGGCRASADAVC